MMFALVQSISAPDIVVNEIKPTISTTDPGWIELINTARYEINLTGVRFSTSFKSKVKSSSHVPSSFSPFNL